MEQLMSKKELSFWDYFALLVKWRKLIVVNFVVICVLAIILSFILPKWYRAETTLLPPVDQSTSAFGLASMLGDLPFGDLGITGMGAPAELFKAILESRTVAQAVIEKWDLMEVYKKEKLEATIQTLWDHTRTQITDEGLITISVEERNPQLAASIANSYVEELDRVNQMSSASQAKSTRIFIEGRLKQTRENLSNAEEALRHFQEENKTVSLTDQTAAVIQSAAELKANQIALEVEKGVLSKTLSIAHPQIVRLQSEIDELQKQLDQITLGDLDRSQNGGESQPRGEGDFNIPLAEVPSVGLHLARLIREVKIQEAIFELLTQQCEQAKIQEAKDTPTVQVLDRAVPPKLRSKPIRRKIVIFGGGLSIFLSFIFIGWVEYINGLREHRQEEYTKLQNLFLELKTDMLPFLKKIGLRGSRKI